MNDSLSIGSDSRESEDKNGMEYIRQDSLQVSVDDDESSKLFSFADSTETNPMRSSSLSLMEHNLLQNEAPSGDDENQLLFQQQTQAENPSRATNMLLLHPNAQAANDETSLNSSSAASETQVQQLGEFLDDLRINSQGQMREASVSNASLDSSIRKETAVEDILRQRAAPTMRIPRAASMEYTKDSFSSADEYLQQQQQSLVGDTIEIMVGAQPPALPPLPGPTSGRTQPHDRQQQQQQQQQLQHQIHYNRMSLKSTIENSGDEWNSNQQQEIGMFSQFALNSTERGTYRQVKTTRHSRQESGEDSSSHASDPSVQYTFSQSPTEQSHISVASGNANRTIRAPLQGGSNHGATYSSSPRNRSIQQTNSDGSHNPGRRVPPPLQLDSNANYPTNMQWGYPQSMPTYYFPGQGRRASENAMAQHYFDMNHQNLHYHYPRHTRSQSATFQQPSPSSAGSYNFHSPQHFSPSPTSSHHFFSEDSRSHGNGSQQTQDSVAYENEQQPQHKRRESYIYEHQRRESYGYVDDVASYSDSDESNEEDAAIEKERNIHLSHAQPHHENQMIHPHHMDGTMPKFDRRQFLPRTSTSFDSEKTKYPTFVCPNCNMRQREFFTVSSAPKQQESEGMLISLLFGVYVVSSLYIFGLQEGWGKLDCFYFAVITLTTAGLGDLVPTTDGAKIICSIFIYFGVACIGLLLGSYIAGMLDERSYREAVANQIKACPNCARIRSMAEQQRRAAFAAEAIAQRRAMSMRRQNAPIRPNHDSTTPRSADLETEGLSTTPNSYQSPQHQQHLLSPMTTKILHRQKHTRHFSMDIRKEDIAKVMGKNAVSSASKVEDQLSGHQGRIRMNSADVHGPTTVNEGPRSIYSAKKNSMSERYSGEREFQRLRVSAPHDTNISELHQHMRDDESTSDESDSSADSLDSEFEEIEGRSSSSKNAKYVIFTLREALVNSSVIILFGCLGFYLIEGFTFVDSLYFTTVLLTSTGYGDIVPKSDGGKLFATVYLLVGGTILLNNMSIISMIPLELRKRRTELSVLTQFGDSLDDDALRELATGPLIQRIHLGGKDSRGLNECTREMFSLAMLIRLGKVTEHDIKLTFAAFRKLDVHNEGILNSKSIIGGLIQKRRRLNLINNNRNGHDAQQRYFPAHGHSYANPATPSNFDGNRTRSSSTHSSYVPGTHGYDMHPSDHAPLLSMSDRGFPQYGVNQQHAYVSPMNQ